jgi:LPXTG-site transpeptidase (sortase) family protein
MELEERIGVGAGTEAEPCPASEIVAAGVLSLILVGGLLAYPYLASRLADIPIWPADSAEDAFVSPLEGEEEPALLLARPDSSRPSAEFSETPTPAPAVPTRIVIPALRLDAPVVPATTSEVVIEGRTQKLWEAPAMHAAGWHNTSAPLGEAGNTVISGHNTMYGEVFRDLYQLGEGDLIEVYAGGRAYDFSVSSVLVLAEGDQPLAVRRQNARYIMRTEDERLTLVTCHPYGSLRYRLVVIARPAALLAGG